MKYENKDIACPVTMKVLGDYWVICIIDELTHGERRFCDIKRAIEGINAVTLTNRLKRLEELQMITRSEETIDNQSVTYALAPLGKEAIPFVDALKAFLKKAGKVYKR